MSAGDKILKEIFDRSVSALSLVLLSPLFLAIALAVKAGDRGTVFFRQTRIGKGGKPFTIFKFRSMTQCQPSSSSKITASGDSRITLVGRFLRDSKLDELPQLWNILRGDMSFVGPRPEVKRYVQLYDDEQKEVLSVRPGLTDFATLEFRNEEKLLAGFDDKEAGYIEVVLPEKLRLSLNYVESASLWVDLKILYKTFWAVIMPDRDK